MCLQCLSLHMESVPDIPCQSAPRQWYCNDAPIPSISLWHILPQNPPLPPSPPPSPFPPSLPTGASAVNLFMNHVIQLTLAMDNAKCLAIGSTEYPQVARIVECAHPPSSEQQWLVSNAGGGNLYLHGVGSGQSR
jgi:hypothetical protein